MGPGEMNPQEASGGGAPGIGAQGKWGAPGATVERALRVWAEQKGGALRSQEAQVSISSPRALCVTLHGSFTLRAASVSSSMKWGSGYHRPCLRAIASSVGKRGLSLAQVGVEGGRAIDAIGPFSR